MTIILFTAYTLLSSADKTYFHRKSLLKLSFLAVFFFLYYFFFVGDYLRLFHHDLRTAKLNFHLSEGLFQLNLSLLLYVFPFLLLLSYFFIRVKSFKNFGIFLLLLIISSQGALSLIQSTNTYCTRFYYGVSIPDYMRVVSFVNALEKNSVILDHHDFAVSAANIHARCASFRYRDWDSPLAIQSTLATQKPEALIYGMPSHTVQQMKTTFTNKELLKYLKQHYVEYHTCPK